MSHVPRVQNQRRGAHKSGITAKRGRDDRNRLEGGHGVTPDDVMYARFKKGESIRHPAPKDNTFRAEHVNGRGNALAKIHRLLGDQMQAMRIAGAGPFEYIPGINGFDLCYPGKIG